MSATPAEIAMELRESDQRKCLLHQGRMEAFDAMKDAIAWHDFMRRADEAERYRSEQIAHDLRAAVSYEARRLAAEAAPVLLDVPANKDTDE